MLLKFRCGGVFMCIDPNEVIYVGWEDDGHYGVNGVSFLIRGHREFVHLPCLPSEREAIANKIMAAQEAAR